MRESLINRPLVLFAVALILGIVSLSNLAAILLLLALIVPLRHLKSALICAVAFLAGAAVGPTINRPIFAKQWLDSNATVASVPKPYATETTAEIRIGNNKLMLSGSPALRIALGQTIRIRGEVKPLTEGSNRLADRGIIGRIWSDHVSIVAQAPWIDRIGQGWRDSFIAFADRALPARAASAVEAVCFNVQSRLDETDREEFARAGTVHAIAASGLHVGILALALLGLMSLFPIPRGVQLVVLALILLLYVVASGINPPVVRASIISLVIGAAYLLRREPDLLSALALAAVVQLFWDPTAVYDAGFQLSFTVLAAIALFATRNRSVPHTRKVVPQTVKTYLAKAALVAVVAAPIAAYDFGSVSLMSIGANALTVVVLPPLVVASMAAHLISFLSASIAAGIMVTIVQPLSGWLLFVTDHFGGQWAALAVPSFSGYWVLLAYALMLVVWRVRLRPA